ncbi:MAG: hypothetical protein M2R45_03608 [Verrucomicrobia subdivision 3 bacterium]|nr:hypothetical protein [Limisphaerales bacterium]MCS1416897.1 hypothetical protein [Limisphaerales bacterium]
MSGFVDLQHVNVKFFLEDAHAIKLEDAINVFHSWIQDQKLDDLLIDVADYRHVPSGPGVILIGHNAQYSFDNAESQLGVLYNRKTPVEAKGAEQIAQAIRMALDVCRLLAKEEVFVNTFKIATDRLQFIVNDRLLGPNNQETYDRLLPQFDAALADVFGEKDFQFERASEPRKRLTVTVQVLQGFTV